MEPEAGFVGCRGRCDAALPGNMGKLMRSTVVRNLRESVGPGRAGEAPQAQRAPEINVCCHGQDAGDEVALMRELPSLIDCQAHAILAALTGLSCTACAHAGFRNEGPCQPAHSSQKAEQLSCHVNCGHALLIWGAFHHTVGNRSTHGNDGQSVSM